MPVQSAACSIARRRRRTGSWRSRWSGRRRRLRPGWGLGASRWSVKASLARRSAGGAKAAAERGLGASWERLRMRHTHTREVAVAGAIAALALVLSIVAPGYFSAENLRDLFLANLPVLLVAIGMTLVIVAGEIDISVGSVFAICGVAAAVLADRKSVL